MIILIFTYIRLKLDLRCFLFENDSQSPPFRHCLLLTGISVEVESIPQPLIKYDF